MKKRVLTLSGVIITLFLIVSVYLYNKNDTYGLIPLNTADWSTITNENKETLVYIGRPSCKQCTEFLPLLMSTIEENKATIYYFDTDKYDSLKKEIIQRYNIISVPSIIVLQNNDFYVIMDSDNQKIIDSISKLLKAN